jgi:hypothetical protein
VVTTTFHGKRKRTERTLFSTRFVRPGDFLFEFRNRSGESEWDQYAVWLEEGRARSWWTIDTEAEEPESLAMAIAGATGVSSGSAYRVPHLLLPDLDEDDEGQRRPPSPARLLDVPEARRLNCVVLASPRHADDDEQLWIDQSTWLIRRVVEPRRKLEPPSAEDLEGLREFDPGLADRMIRDLAETWQLEPTDVESVTTYEPQIDTAIPQAELRFTPPLE